jgi:TusA-related sulfurtransferase
MAVEMLHALGPKCRQPVLKIAVKTPDMKPGDILEILGGLPPDVRERCAHLVSTTRKGPAFREG